jgi:hypothetical protein
MIKIKEEIIDTFKIILPKDYDDPKCPKLSSKVIKALELLRLKYSPGKP